MVKSSRRSLRNVKGGRSSMENVTGSVQGRNYRYSHSPSSSSVQDSLYSKDPSSLTNFEILLSVLSSDLAALATNSWSSSSSSSSLSPSPESYPSDVVDFIPFTKIPILKSGKSKTDLINSGGEVREWVCWGCDCGKKNSSGKRVREEDWEVDVCPKKRNKIEAEIEGSSRSPSTPLTPKILISRPSPMPEEDVKPAVFLN